jgi:hypothetical protein
MTGFHNLLEIRASSLLMLLGWRSILVASLKAWTMHWVLVERILMGRGWT